MTRAGVGFLRIYHSLIWRVQFMEIGCQWGTEVDKKKGWGPLV